MADPSTLSEIDKLKGLLNGTYSPPPVRRPRPEDVALFAGIAGATAAGEIEIMPGLVVRPTYAHFFGHFMLAVAPPVRPSAPHPSPWFAANGGPAYDIKIEAALAADARPFGMERLRALWLLTAVARLWTLHPIRTPIVTDTAFSEAATAGPAPAIWTIEREQYVPHWIEPCALDETALSGIAETFRLAGALYCSDEAFRRALETLDAVWLLPTAEARLMAAWTALEALYRPSRKNRGATKNLARAVGAHLGADRRERDRYLDRVRMLAEVRGGTAHAGDKGSQNALAEVLQIAQMALLKTISEGRSPNAIDDDEAPQGA